MNANWQPLLDALVDPGSLLSRSEAQWDLLLRQAYTAGLLGRLGLAVQQLDAVERIPRPVWHAMESMLTLVGQQQRAVRWELQLMQALLSDLPGPVLLLKGAAYCAGKLPPAAGRLFADIDLLVPREQLGAAEAALMLGGWVSETKTAYDDRYYRRWMHELPPMIQVARGTALDLHHRLLPLSARLQTPPEPLFETAEPIPGLPRFLRPQDLDLILHSACHWFHEGEWNHGLRDLVDLDLLVRDALRRRGESLWAALLQRAALLNLGRPLWFALWNSQRWLRCPVPAQVLRDCPSRPGALRAAALNALLRRAFSSPHRASRLPGSALACGLLYLRAHALRMPPHLLIPHLITKAWLGWQERLKKKPSQHEGADAAANLERG